MENFFENVAMPDDRFRIDSFYCSNFKHVLEVHPHWHPEIEILYFSSGQATQQVNENYFVVDEGDIVIINKDQLHSTYSYQGGKCDILVLMFDSLNMLCSVYDDPILSNGVVFKNPIWTGESYGKEILDCMVEINRELSKKESAYQYAVKSQLYRLIGTLVKSGCHEAVGPTRGNSRLVKNMLENTFRLIDERYNTDISLKEAAQASNLSTPHFCRLFKMTTGMTFMEYLAFYRVNRAERLLATHKSITQIAYESGFGSLSAFIRNYKKFKNCTPSACRGL